MKKILVILMLVFAFGWINEAIAVDNNTIVGKWKKDFPEIEDKNSINFIMELLKDGTLSFSFFASDLFIDEVSGTYTYSDNIITLLDEENENIEGKYSIEFKENVLEFTLIEDECKRSTLLPGTFKKVED